MKQELEKIKQRFVQELAGVKSPDELAKLDIKNLGRKAGALTGILRGLKENGAE